MWGKQLALAMKEHIVMVWPNDVHETARNICLTVRKR